jgi:hypothetical protein
MALHLHLLSSGASIAQLSLTASMPKLTSALDSAFAKTDTLITTFYRLAYAMIIIIQTVQAASAAQV